MPVSYGEEWNGEQCPKCGSVRVMKKVAAFWVNSGCEVVEECDLSSTDFTDERYCSDCDHEFEEGDEPAKPTKPVKPVSKPRKRKRK